MAKANAAEIGRVEATDLAVHSQSSGGWRQVPLSAISTLVILSGFAKSIPTNRIAIRIISFLYHSPIQ
jgi:hypothetical protein